jgi:ABC-2 type transport system ATP-binding protein
MNILELQNLKKHYATHKAVDDISFTIPKGSIFGLLGPNGAGKTTLLRMITGIFYPDSGNVLFEGRPLDFQTDIRHIGYMPEERGLYKKMKVAEHALYLAQLKGLPTHEAKSKIDEWFTRFDLHKWADKKVEELSKGMQQKVQFISTVLHEPKLLILDEPFSGLDPINSLLIQKEIFDMAHRGTTIIFSTHRMEQVEEICDQIVLVNQGKKILDGTIDQIQQDFKEHIYHIELERQANPAEMATHHFSIVRQNGSSYVLKLSDHARHNDLLGHFMHHGIQINYFKEILPTIGEVFIKQVNQTAGQTVANTAVYE